MVSCELGRREAPRGLGRSVDCGQRRGPVRPDPPAARRVARSPERGPSHERAGLDSRHSTPALVSAKALAQALSATDDPPQLVLLNSCDSAAQIDQLVANVTPFAIGMADEINDGDAITYATQFYAALANGQSVLAAHDGEGNVGGIGPAQPRSAHAGLWRGF
jgi:hypothetical protein